ncbi:MAG TPA: class I SAM-dependent methyltransferase [Acidimicrobiales bacterium]|nr:class I SAM-dependent methyltransferase [Acidimicrobiales bacterium]
MRVLSRVKYWVCRPLSARTYWSVMGKLKPVGAVTSTHGDIERSMASGAEVVTLLQGLGVVHADAVTLHIGSGLGRVEQHLSAHVQRCHGTDISPSMVARANELVTADNVEFVCTDGRGLGPWDDGTFDLVYSFLVFQHLPRQQFHRYVEEAHAKLKEGGHFVFQILVDEHESHPEPPPSHPYGIRYYRRADVEGVLRRARFAQVRRTDPHGRADDGSRSVGDVVFCAVKE